jgi:hypothetical protein
MELLRKFDADAAFGCWHCVEMGCVADISEDHQD